MHINSQVGTIKGDASGPSTNARGCSCCTNRHRLITVVSGRRKQANKRDGLFQLCYEPRFLWSNQTRTEFH